MLFINLGIFAGVCVGKYAYHKLKQRQSTQSTQVGESTTTTIRASTAPIEVDKSTKADCSIEQTVTQPASDAQTQQVFDNKVSDPKKKPRNYLASVKVSAVSALMSAVGYVFYYPLALLSVGAVSYTTQPIVADALETWRKDHKLNSDGYSALVTLLLLSLGGAFAAAMHNVLYYMSHHLIQKSRADTTQLTTHYFEQIPTHVWLAIPGIDKQIPLDEVKQGNRLIISTANMIPVDGVIITGSALVDEQAITGETTVVEKTTGDTVLAATLVVGGRIIISANHSGAETRLHKLDQLLQKSDGYQTELQLKGEAWANQLALPLIVTSTALVPVIGSSAALTLLFSAPLNTVRSILSVQTSAHLQRMMQYQILIKDGRSLEAIKHIDTILFDKTGTLTQAQPEVIQILTCADLSKKQLLALAAASEQQLEHPIARAIVAYAAQQALTLPKINHSEYKLGLGLTAKTDDHIVHIGSERFIRQITQQQGDFPDPIHAHLIAHQGHSFVFIAVDYRLQGIIELSPRVREEVPALIQYLRQQPLLQQLAIVSGDQQAPVDRLAKQLGFDAAYGSVLPQEKAQIIADLQAQGRNVCFIGDGLNDALAMKQADVSISLQSASSLTSEVAQIVLLDDNLNSLQELFHLTQHLHKSLKHSIYFWVGFGAGNAMAVPLFALNPIQASLLYTSAYFSGIKLSSHVPKHHSLNELPKKSGAHII